MVAGAAAVRRGYVRDARPHRLRRLRGPVPGAPGVARHQSAESRGRPGDVRRDLAGPRRRHRARSRALGGRHPAGVAGLGGGYGRLARRAARRLRRRHVQCLVCAPGRAVPTDQRRSDVPHRRRAADGDVVAPRPLPAPLPRPGDSGQRRLRAHRGGPGAPYRHRPARRCAPRPPTTELTELHVQPLGPARAEGLQRLHPRAARSTLAHRVAHPGAVADGVHRGPGQDEQPRAGLRAPAHPARLPPAVRRGDPRAAQVAPRERGRARTASAHVQPDAVEPAREQRVEPRSRGLFLLHHSGLPAGRLRHPAHAVPHPPLAELGRAQLAAARHAEPEQRHRQHARSQGLQRLELAGPRRLRRAPILPRHPGRRRARPA